MSAPRPPVALITGAGGGIGAATARLLAESGWEVCGLDLTPPPSVALALAGDVADEATWTRAAEAVQARFGRLDALVNNAAVQICGPLVETEPADFDRVLAVNVRGPYLACRALVGLLRVGGGAIVNVSSVHAVATSANIAAYAASKGALLAMTRALAIELAPDGIRVNALLPGAVDTPMLRSGLGRGHMEAGAVQTQLDELGRRTVIGRVADPMELARAIRFLCTDESSFMTGAPLIVDGGATIRLSTE